MAFFAASASGAWAGEKQQPMDSGWYFHGGLDVGGRGYIDRPPSGFGYGPDGKKFLLPTQTDSRAKWEEYGEIPPGLFLDWIHLDIGSNDGRYKIDFLGKDVGYNAQSYQLDFSEAGRQYLSLGWDQTPHLYSTSAKSLFSGVGTTNLTVPDSIQAALQAQLAAAGGSNAAGLAARQTIDSIINGNATHIDELATRRDTFSVGYRLTPTPQWDFRVNYSHEDRTGTMPGTLDYRETAAFPNNTLGIPYPVNDTTQRPEGSGEYIGASPWGAYNIKLGYSGSIYTDHLALLNIENPFGQTGGSVDFGPGTIRVGLPPSNQAHAFSASGATDIPIFMSRFTTTNQYSRITQNEPFTDTANNGLTTAPLPAASLNGEVKTFLTNNVLTSSFTDTLHNKVRVRYYEHDNNTQDLTFGQVVLADSEASAGPFMTEYLSYNKTNIDENLTWDPWPWLTVGAGYGYERWNRKNRFTTKTNQNTGNTFARVVLTDWATLRASYSYSARRYEGEYEILPSEWLNSRMFDLANRNEQRARTLIQIAVNDSVTVTPTAGLRWDDYPEDTLNQVGVSHEHAWNAGVDIGLVLSPTFRVNAGYNYERIRLDMSAAVPDAGGTGVCNFPGYIDFVPYTVPSDCIWSDKLTQSFHTVVASADWAAIPDTLDFRVNYAASWQREVHDFVPCPLNNRNCNGLAVAGVSAAQVWLPWPDNTSLYQRVDAVVRYTVDPNVVQMLGINGKVVAKLRYTWESNAASFWQSDALNAYFGTTSGGVTELTGTSKSTFLAYDNLNTQAQIIAGSVEVTW